MWKWTGPVAEGAREQLERIPGVKVRDESVSAPINVAWLAGQILSNLPLSCSDRPAPWKAKTALPYLREWVPEFLTHYQREGVATALALPGGSGHLWWAPGAGKTLGAIVWALAAGPAITVVVTKSAVRNQWAREVERFTKGVHVEVLEGRDPCDLSVLSHTLPAFFILGYEVLPAWIEQLEALGPLSVVFDESHKVKSHRRWDPVLKADGSTEKVKYNLKDNIAGAALRLSKSAKRRLCTTGTPIGDRVRDLWAQLDLVHPWAFGSFYEFARRYCSSTENPFGGVDTRGKSNLDELKKRLSFVSHRVSLSEACRDLPPLRNQVTYLKVSEQVPPAAIAAEMKAAIKKARLDPTALIEMRLMESAGRKRKWILDRVLDGVEGGLKICVFTGRRRDAERLAEDIRKKVHPQQSTGNEADGELGSAGPAGNAPTPSTPVWCGHGGDSVEARDAMKDAYMAYRGACVLVGTVDAWGEGYNLQDTDLGIVAQLPYTPKQLIQLRGRWARLGQERPVLVLWPVCEGTIDEHVASILLEKLPAVEKTIGGDETAGLSRELVGASEEELISSLAAKVLQSMEQSAQSMEA